MLGAYFVLSLSSEREREEDSPPAVPVHTLVPLNILRPRPRPRPHPLVCITSRLHVRSFVRSFVRLFVRSLIGCAWLIYSLGSPRISCALEVAHFSRHSGRHSERDRCSEPLGLVHSNMHLDRQDSKLGSFLVPLRDGSISLARTGVGAQAAAAVPANMTLRKAVRDSVASCAGCGDSTVCTLLRLLLLLLLLPNENASALRERRAKVAASNAMITFNIVQSMARAAGLRCGKTCSVERCVVLCCVVVDDCGDRTLMQPRMDYAIACSNNCYEE